MTDDAFTVGHPSHIRPTWGVRQTLKVHLDAVSILSGETSDGAKPSSGSECGGGEGLGRVVELAGLEAVEEPAEHPVGLDDSRLGRVG